MKYLPRLSWIKRNKKKSIAIFILLLLLFVIFRPKAAKPIPTSTIKIGDVTQTVSASGAIESEKSVNLTFLAGGKLSYLGVKRGDKVKASQVIASLDQRTAQTNMENALIDYAKERNSFDTTKQANGNRQPQDALNDAMKRVLEDNQQDLNKAVNSVELQELTKEQSTLVTPIGGIVTRADITTSGVNIGPTATFTIADPDNLRFSADIDESDVGKVHEGQQMQISLDAFPDQTINATIDSIDFASHATATGGTAYTVQATLSEGSNTNYRIGMNGDAEVVVAKRSNVLIVPLSSLIDDTHVYVQKGKLFEKRTIKLGLQSDTEAEVLNGLSDGEKVGLTPDEVEKQFPKLKS